MRSLPFGKGARAFVALLLVFGLVGVASAGTVTFSANQGASESSLGNYDGTICYSYDASTSTGTLDIALTNTSPASNGGYLTAFAFNVSGDVTLSGLSFTSAVSNFGLLSDFSASPFGDFEWGAGIKSAWSSGDPKTGLADGATATFTFDVTGADAATLGADDFFSESSTDTKKPAVFLARFRGFDDGGSDKVPGEIVAVPVPLAAWAGMGMLGLLGLVRRRRLRERRAA